MRYAFFKHLSKEGFVLRKFKPRWDRRICSCHLPVKIGRVSLCIDCMQHTLVVGQTGTGKTMLLKHIVSRLAELDRCKIVLFDFKGVLYELLRKYSRRPIAVVDYKKLGISFVKSVGEYLLKERNLKRPIPLDPTSSSYHRDFAKPVFHMFEEMSRILIEAFKMHSPTGREVAALSQQYFEVGAPSQILAAVGTHLTLWWLASDDRESDEACEIDEEAIDVLRGGANDGGTPVVAKLAQGLRLPDVARHVFGEADQTIHGVITELATDVSVLEVYSKSEKLVSAYELLEGRDHIYLSVDVSRMSHYTALITVALNLIFMALIQGGVGRYDEPLVFIIDEFHRFPHTRLFDAAVNLLREYGVTFVVAVQNLSRLSKHADAVISAFNYIFSFAVGPNDARILGPKFSAIKRKREGGRVAVVGETLERYLTGLPPLTCFVFTPGQGTSIFQVPIYKEQEGAGGVGLKIRLGRRVEPRVSGNAHGYLGRRTSPPKEEWGL